MNDNVWYWNFLRRIAWKQKNDFTFSDSPSTAESKRLHLWNLIRFRFFLLTLIHQIKHICCVKDFSFNTLSIERFLHSPFDVAFFCFFFFTTKLIYVEENYLDCDPSNLIWETPLRQGAAFHWDNKLPEALE